ncbi:hypothetical protein H0H87_011765 [Tephrocybe sp. NHM501043]|nr:hypothetical protein H0H87_011765 [Tephrocybe sp. NHM501043]
MATIFLDDTSSHITYVNYRYPNVNWQTTTSNSFVGGSVVEIQAPVTLSVVFTVNDHIGVSFTIYGLTISSVEMGVTVDNGTRQTVTALGATTDTDRSTVWPWYTSPTLSDSTHNVTLSDPALMLDYILVTAGNDTPLRGERLLVDDGDPAITYTGSWTRNTSTLIGSDGYLRKPVGNSTRQSNDTGATMTFTFTGTSLSLVGPCNFADDPNHINIFMDGSEVPRRIPTATSIPDPTFVWYSTDSLAAGNHTVKVLVVDVSPSPGKFTLDYILYSPSFDTLATKTSSTLDPTTNSNSSTGSSTNPGAATAENTHTSISNGAIAGIVIGVIVAAIVILLAFWYKRRVMQRNSTTKGSTVNPFPLGGGAKMNNKEERSLTVDTHKQVPATPSAFSESMIVSSSVLDQSIGSHNHLDRFVLPEYREEGGTPGIIVQRKPRLHEKDASQERQLGSQGDDEVPISATPANQGSSRTRVEHLRQLVVDIQREIAESDPNAAQEDGAFMREMLNAAPVVTQGEHYGTDHHSVSMTLPPPYETEHPR